MTEDRPKRIKLAKPAGWPIYYQKEMPKDLEDKCSTEIFMVSQNYHGST